MVDGNGGWNLGVANRRLKWAAASERFATTFCSDTALPGFTPANTREYTVAGQDIRCPVYAERGESSAAKRYHAEIFLVHIASPQTAASASCTQSYLPPLLLIFVQFPSLVSPNADVNGSCLANVNYTATQAEASRRSARICTANELIFACGKGSGCNHDSEFIWSSQLDPT